MPLEPETAVHGGFSLAVNHFISEITDFPLHPGELQGRETQGVRGEISASH